MKSFLIPIGGSETDEPLFATALAAARPFSSHLQFLHVHIGPGQAAANMPHTSFAMGPALANALRDLDVKAQTRSATAARHFRDFCARSGIEICDAPDHTKGVTASWHQEDGYALKRIMFRARHNDLVVVGRAKTANGLPSDFLEQLLMVAGGRCSLRAPRPSRCRPARSWCAGRRPPRRPAPSTLRCRFSSTPSASSS
jgi:hypothetical protein